MQTIAIARLLRAVRLRRDWRQADVAARARMSAAGIGRHENGRFGSLRSLEQHASALGLRVEVRLTGRGGELAKLRDEEHAAIVEFFAGWFRDAGFTTEVEASFSQWGERGRVDLLAHDPVTALLVIVEIKTQLVDLQDLMGALNVKERLAPTVARTRGWAVRRQLTLLGVASTHANRGLTRTHRSLFGAFAPRRLTRAALSGDATRILCWVPPEATSRSRPWVAGRQRVIRRQRIGGGNRGRPVRTDTKPSLTLGG